ncbi:hypothetical protein QEH53_23305 [Pelagicoccus sp. SDUM812002]|nr:hypothetical protein [Pelagicoccus sp. SDUM812002]
MTYQLNESGLRLRCKNLDIRATWDMVSVWEDKEGWLRISCEAIPNLYFKTSKLKEAGVFDSVIDLCNKYGVKFNSEEAKMISNKSGHTTPAIAPR